MQCPCWLITLKSSGCFLSGRFGCRGYWYRRRENKVRNIVKLWWNCFKMVPKGIEISLKCKKMIPKWHRNGAWGVPGSSGEVMVWSRTLLGSNFWVWSILQLFGSNFWSQKWFFFEVIFSFFFEVDFNIDFTDLGGPILMTFWCFWVSKDTSKIRFQKR